MNMKKFWNGFLSKKKCVNIFNLFQQYSLKMLKSHYDEFL